MRSRFELWSSQLSNLKMKFLTTKLFKKKKLILTYLEINKSFDHNNNFFLQLYPSLKFFNIKLIFLS
jgi:hypothetical protein